MKPIVLLCLGLILLVPSLLTAKVVIVPHDPAHAERSVGERESMFSRLQLKIDRPDNFLILPFYEVDTTNAAGTTTLFAVRNTESTVARTVFTYFDQMTTTVRVDEIDIDPEETRSFNLRDIAGLPVSDGISRGFAVVIADNPALLRKGIVADPPQLTGDFFLVDIGGAFATGERLISDKELCVEHEIRFLDFGSGTSLRLFVSDPLGSDEDNDPPSVTVTPIGEDGAVFASKNIFTDQTSFEVQASEFTAEQFGTLVFNFSNSQSGWVYAEYSADGLFSVGLNSTCTIPVGPGPL